MSEDEAPSRNHDRIVVLRGEGGQFHWRWVSSNGRVLCHSENYTRKSWCVRMAKRISGGRVPVEFD